MDQDSARDICTMVIREHKSCICQESIMMYIAELKQEPTELFDIKKSAYT